MGIHDRIGVEIVRSAFACQDLADIIESHHAFFGGKGRHKHLPTGKDIPLGARFLSIADAYDAMVSDRVYRKGMSQADAFATRVVAESMSALFFRLQTIAIYCNSAIKSRLT